MARAVYSRRFITQAGLSGRGASVIVPVGHVYVVKQLTMYLDPTLLTTRAYFEHEPSGAALFTDAVTAENAGWFGFYGQLVFEAGEGFHWQVDGESADVSASGYDLTAT